MIGEARTASTKQPYHSANLVNSFTASTRIRFSVHTGGRIGYVALLYEEEAQPKARIELHCQPSSEFRDIGASLYSPNFKAGLETGRWAIPTMRDTYLTFTKDGFVDQIKVIVFGGSGHVDLHRFMPVLMGY